MGDPIGQLIRKADIIAAQSKSELADAAAKAMAEHCDLRMAKAKAEISALNIAIERMLIGGNHLATYSADWPAWGLDGLTREQQCEHALRRMGAGKEYDMWVCWSEIMQARAYLEDAGVRPA